MAMGTSLSYTSNLEAARVERAFSGRNAVEGMPRRSRYEADQGWELLLEPRRSLPVVAPPARAGATARPLSAPPRAEPTLRSGLDRPAPPIQSPDGEHTPPSA